MIDTGGVIINDLI